MVGQIFMGVSKHSADLIPILTILKMHSKANVHKMAKCPKKCGCPARTSLGGSKKKNQKGYPLEQKISKFFVAIFLPLDCL